MKTKSNKKLLFGIIALTIASAAITALIDCKTKEANSLPTSESSYLIFIPNITTDEQTEETAVVWGSAKDWDSQENPLWFDDIPVAEDLPEFAPYKSLTAEGVTVAGYKLAEEDDYTVLHCYYQMPADMLKNFWLASEETGIVDLETGTNYRAIRTVPDCMGKNFGVKSKRGTVLDFQIYFPKLPRETKEVAVYGIPNWHMRGTKVKLEQPDKTTRTYDKTPHFHLPNLIKAEENYDKNDGSTWAVYTEPHLIKPVEDGTMALWCTPEATYLARACEQNWMREYFGMQPGTMLVDEHGKQYKLVETQGLPNDNHIFWMEGYSGDYFAFLHVFEPLPPENKTISFIEPDGEPFEAWGANWKGQTLLNLDVETLKKNQPLFEYKKRNIVK